MRIHRLIFAILGRRCLNPKLFLAVILLLGAPLSAQQSSPAVAKPQAAEGTWQITHDVDPRTDKPRSFARQRVEGLPKGRFEVTASCDEDAFFNFQLYSQNSGASILRSTVPIGPTAMNGGEPGQSCARLSVRVGEGLPHSYYSKDCTDNSRVSVMFIGLGLWRRTANREDATIRDACRMMSPNCDGPALEAFSEWLRGLNQVGGIMTGSALAGSGLILDYQDVLDGKPISIEVPFRDGSTSTLNLDIQSGAFRDFANSCSAGVKRTELENAMGGALRGNVWSDSETGLTWEGQDNGQGVDWNQAVAYCQNLRFGGGADWRLPEIDELMSIYDKSQSVPGNGIGANQKFPVRGNLRISGSEWSNTAGDNPRDAQAAFFFEFAHALSAPRTRSVSAICVRGKQKPKSTEETWKDPSTNLEWAMRDNGFNVNWPQAVAFCHSLSLDGYSDWRLPEIDELKGIYDPSQSVQGYGKWAVNRYHIKGQIQLTVQSDEWSNTKYAAEKVYAFVWLLGRPIIDRTQGSNGARALCVRHQGGTPLPMSERPAVAAVSPPPEWSVETSNKPDPRAMRISGGVASGFLLSKTAPVYPADAKAAGVSGTVVLQATISKAGTIESLKTISGDPRLATAAISAVKNWRYRPYLMNNQPVELVTTISVTFQ